MSRKDFLELLRWLGRCQEAASWIRSQRGATPEELWNRCDYWPWMTWLLMALDMPAARCDAMAALNGGVGPDGDRIRGAVTWPRVERAAIEMLAELREEKP